MDLENLHKISSSSEHLAFWLENSGLLGESQKQFEHYYRSYKVNFSNYIKFYYEQQTKELIEIIESKPSCKVLDIGCGCGVESLWMALKGASVLGIDITESQMRIANAIKDIINREFVIPPPDIEFEKISILDIPNDEKFDVLWMEQSFHHLEPRVKVLEKLNQIVNQDGYIVFSESNAWNILNQLFLLKFRSFKTIISEGSHMWGNERIITPYKLSNLLNHYGFQVKSCRYYRTLPNKRWADVFLKYDRNLPQLFKPLFTHYNLVAKKV